MPELDGTLLECEICGTFEDVTHTSIGTLCKIHIAETIDEIMCVTGADE